AVTVFSPGLDSFCNSKSDSPSEFHHSACSRVWCCDMGGVSFTLDTIGRSPCLYARLTSLLRCNRSVYTTPFSYQPRITMSTLPRIERVPPYVFNITGELKMAARRRGEDIIYLSMGNPDGPTPRHIVDKLIEVVNRPDTHGYSVSKGIPRLRKAISGWYERR